MGDEPRSTRTLLPGLFLLVSLGVAAKLSASFLGWGTPLIFAVLFGALLSNSYGLPGSLEPGVNAYKLLLEVGIVLLGASISLTDVIDAGPRILGLTVAVVAFGILLVEFLARYVFGLTGRTPALLATGSSICGVSAVLAVAGTIDASENDIAYATATILVFDALTLVAFPIAGSVLDMSSVSFGIWSGLSMFSTGPVAAAGFAYSQTAGEWATLTKLTRNSLIGLVVLAYSFSYSLNSDERASPRMFWEQFPKFLVGFFLVAVIANLPGISTGFVDTVGTVSDWLFVFAFVGLGCGIQAKNLRQTGVRPFLTVLFYLLIISTVSLFAIRVIF
ncbi:YeiH family protein [Haloarcula nitratireducens]|uniref:Sulfate exporter family transporter n=1 Tax=Haloarcula nitratireducens TaxID=2487749 RepID=A0AAW4PJ37_9EURY|nr:putative sulfate exporter family transporter [Halomicroarcula nitratireducens]MBX0297415.1 putative sulfate exporter family transporter [Halomicroarcula nitratireducens]